jgi:hypothetical protein
MDDDDTCGREGQGSVDGDTSGGGGGGSVDGDTCGGGGGWWMVTHVEEKEEDRGGW